MIDGLIVALLEKKAFEHSTIVTARYTSIDVFGRRFEKKGDFQVKNILRNKNQTLFELTTLTGGLPAIVASAQDIELIDGMDVQRYADIYDILPDGSQKKVGRKRGRKPKVLMH